jgi:uncharacterized membrane protein YeaQ/YmgE (transglycosylase-associated protein family)
MNWIWWISVGFVAGALAKALMPGSKKEPTGCLFTILLGIAGAVTVGFLMDLMGYRGVGGTIPTIVGATLGACLLLWLARKFSK